MAVSRELGESRAAEDGTSAGIPADVDTIKGLAEGAEPVIDGAEMELEMGVGRVETTGNRFLIWVAAEDLGRFSCWTASA